MTKNKELQDHADKLGEIITQQTNKRLQLEDRIIELEEEIRILKKEKEVSDHTHKCKCCEEIVDDLDFNCELGLCYYCLDMMKEEEE